MKKINVGISIEILINKSADKFFRKHNEVYIKFLENIKSHYLNENSNIDIVAMKTYKGIYRMRINDYRIIYKLDNGKIKLIEVLMVKSRGEIYKKF